MTEHRIPAKTYGSCIDLEDVRSAPKRIHAEVLLRRKQRRQRSLFIFCSHSEYGTVRKQVEEAQLQLATIPRRTQCPVNAVYHRVFSSHEGSCLDPFGSALTTSIACLETGRNCISMDSVDEAFKLAIAIIRIYPTPGATMHLLEEYADVELDEDSK